MNFLNCCGRICVVLDMVVLIHNFTLVPYTFLVHTHEVSEVLWAYLCSVGYGGSKAKIWH